MKADAEGWCGLAGGMNRSTCVVPRSGRVRAQSALARPRLARAPEPRPAQNPAATGRQPLLLEPGARPPQRRQAIPKCGKRASSSVPMHAATTGILIRGISPRPACALRSAFATRRRLGPAVHANIAPRRASMKVSFSACGPEPSRRAPWSTVERRPGHSVQPRPRARTWHLRRCPSPSPDQIPKSDDARRFAPPRAAAAGESPAVLPRMLPA